MESIWVIFALIGFLLQGIYIFISGKGFRNLELAIKGLASVCFVVVGALALKFTSAPAYGWLVVLGLTFGAAGDVLLQLGDFTPETKRRFILGTTCFLIGHLFYIAAILTLGRLFLAWSIPLAVIACLLLVPAIRRQVQPPREIELFGIGYVTVLVVMAVFAFGQMFAGLGHLGRYLLVLGALSFAFSDCVLIVDAFGRPLPASSLIVLSSYYLGQLLIALSIFSIA
ncbi:MAG: lysoplasmalogenase [Christensenellales bacterium]